MKTLIILIALLTQNIDIIIPPEKRLTNKIVFVIDMSGSMTPIKVGQAIKTCIMLMSQATDDLEISVVVFKDDYTQWPGIPGPHKNWTLLPSAEAVGLLRNWLESIPPNGGTNPSPAMRVALTMKRKAISIILISDGLFDVKPVLKTIRTFQKWREKNNYGKAGIMVWGSNEKPESLRLIAKEGGLGFWVKKEKNNVQRLR